jgi:hypothetical protein
MRRAEELASQIPERMLELLLKGRAKGSRNSRDLGGRVRRAKVSVGAAGETLRMVLASSRARIAGAMGRPPREPTRAQRESLIAARGRRIARGNRRKGEQRAGPGGKA